MVLPLIILGLGASGATMTLVLDLFLKRPFVSAAVAGFLPPTALALVVGSGHLDLALTLALWGVAAFLTAGPAFGVALWRRSRARPPLP